MSMARVALLFPDTWHPSDTQVRAFRAYSIQIAIHHLEDVRQKMADLARLERLLASTVEQCSGGHVPQCAVIEMLESATR